MQSSNTNSVERNSHMGRRNFFFSQYFVIFIILLVSVYEMGIQKLYGFSIYPDEFGYWASAAKWIGYDWSDVASLGSYYSFGYSLLLTPVLYFCKDGLSAYRMAVTMNLLLHCGSLFFLYRILYKISNAMIEKEELAKEDRERRYAILFASAVAFFYPVWVFYMQMTLTESLLSFLYLAICFFLLCFLEKPRIISAILLALLLLFIYFVHMRTVAVSIAAVLTLCIWAWKKPAYRRLTVIGMVVFAVGAVIGFGVKNVITDAVYAMADTNLLAVNDYVGQFSKIKDILTFHGMIKFMKGCAGKLYYLGMASFGLLYPVIGEGIKDIADAFCGKTEERKHHFLPYFFCFLLLSLMGQFLISAISMHQPGRLDGIVYGRYNDYLLPVFLGIGVLVLFKSHHVLRQFGIAAGISTGLFLIAFQTARKSGLTLMQGYFAAGISYLSDDRNYQMIPEFLKAYLFGIVLIAIFYGVIAIAKNSRRGIFFIGILIGTELILVHQLNTKYTYLFNRVDEYDLQIYQAINTEYPVQYLYGGGQAYIDLIQFYMMDKSIQVVSMKENNLNEDNILQYQWKSESYLIVDIENETVEVLEENYEKCAEGRKFALFWVE